MENILNNYNVDYKLISANKYFYNNNPVPRVTELLSEINEKYLMDWANSLGFRRKKYRSELEIAAHIGTQVHDFIDKYLKHKEYKELSRLDDNNFEKINNGVNSFLLWYNDVFENNQITILSSEQELVCPWFGGTYDILMNINGKTYLGDFKTSNNIGYKYFMQLSAYKYILENYHSTKVDGCIILQLDKKCIQYEEYFLDFNNPNHLDFINQCTTTFLSLVYTYYNKLQTMEMYNNIFNKRR